jgi:hypothetical protein
MRYGATLARRAAVLTAWLAVCFPVALKLFRYRQRCRFSASARRP